MLKIQCPNQACRQTYKIADDRIGNTVKCKKCGHRFSVEFSGSQAVAIPEEDHSSQGQDSAAQHPDRIERFEVQNFIDSGAFGAVYKARDPQLQRDVAVKLLKLNNEPKSDSHKIRRFLQEGRAAARLQHPHIVPVFDAGKDTVSGEYFLAAAFIEGQTLKSFAGKNPLENSRAALMTSQLAQALEYAHRRGVLHRDVKPENVMVDQDGTPYLMDFGIARLDDSEERMTQDGSLLGTPAFMSPEQFVGKHEELTGASDQYSLGCVLYQLLTGRTPFDGNWQSQLHYHLNETPAPPSKHNPTVPRDLETICLKCLSKEASERYASCGDLSEDLERWLEGEPISARPLSRIQRFARWCKKEPVVASLTAGVFLVFAVGLAATSWQWSRAETEKQKVVDAQVGLKTANVELTTKQSQLITAQKKATAQTLVATNRRNEALRQLYISKMGQAQIAWEENRYNAVKQILNETVPGDGEPDFRGWEWYHFNAVNAPKTTLLESQAGGSHLYEHNYTRRLNIQWSPDGKYLLSTRYTATNRPEDQFIRVWEAETLKLVMNVPGTAERAVWNRQSTQFAVSYKDKIYVWKISSKKVDITLQVPAQLKGYPGNYIRDMTWNSAGDRIACIYIPRFRAVGRGPGLSHIVVWDTSNGKDIYKHEMKNVSFSSIAWSPHSNEICASFMGLTEKNQTLSAELITIDGTTFDVLRRLEKGTVSNFSSLMISANGRSIGGKLASRVPPTFEIWDSNLKNKLSSIYPCGSASALPDFELVATTGLDTGVLAIVAPKSRSRDELAFMEGVNHQVAIHPGGKRIAACYYPSRNQTPKVEILNINDVVVAKQYVPIRCQSMDPTDSENEYLRCTGIDVACFDWFDGNENICCGTNDGHIVVVDSVVNQEIYARHVSENSIDWLGINSQDDRVAVLSKDGVLQIVSLESGNNSEPIKCPLDNVTCAAWSLTYDAVIVVGDNGRLLVWSPKTGLTDTEFTGHDSRLTSISATKNFVVGSDIDGRVWAWRPSDPSDPFLLHDNSSVVVEILKCGDRTGELLAGSDSNGSILLWSLNKKRLLQRIETGGERISSLACTPNGDRLAAAMTDGFVRIYDPIIGSQITRLKLDLRYSEATSLAWSTDGNALAASRGNFQQLHTFVGENLGQLCIWRGVVYQSNASHVEAD